MPMFEANADTGEILRELMRDSDREWGLGAWTSHITRACEVSTASERLRGLVERHL
jgi:hypothetical protein